MKKKLYHWAVKGYSSDLGVRSTLCGKKTKSFVYWWEVPGTMGTCFDEAHRPCKKCLALYHLYVLSNTEL